MCIDCGGTKNCKECRQSDMRPNVKFTLSEEYCDECYLALRDEAADIQMNIRREQ